MYRRLPIILHDLSMVIGAWALAIIIRYDWPLAPEVGTAFWQALPFVIGVQAIALWQSGLHRSIWRFVSMYDLALILRSVIAGTLGIIAALVLFNRLELIPRSSLIFYPFLLTFLLGMPRLLYRLSRERLPPHFPFSKAGIRALLKPQARQRVLVIGAGTSGDMLVRDMLRNRDCGYIPVGFLDDEQRLHGGKVQGVPVLGGIDSLIEAVKAIQADAIVIAVPSATEEQMRRIVELCEACAIPVRTLPRLDIEEVEEQVNVDALRDIAIEDLLGRPKVQLDWHLIAAGLRDKRVMVSGGGGSIGAELCYQIMRLQPQKLIIFERCEHNLYQVEMQLRKAFPAITLHACLGDVTDSVAVHHVLHCYQPEVVFHAAAYKHVPMLQFQVREAVRNNVLGTHLLTQAVATAGCQTFVMVSTDKAVNPTSIMGTTKRAAEMLCQAMNAHSSTRFVTVRFGNVLGSAGSVVPLFKAQIAQGGPVTVTHPDISRYFMTIPEACQFILQVSTMGKGGEIFVLDMGKPIKIRYLAEQMIKLSGKVPERDIHIVYTGLRPGEKLHEELFYCHETLETTAHPKILRVAQQDFVDADLTATLAKLALACEQFAEDEILEILQQVVGVRS